MWTSAVDIWQLGVSVSLSIAMATEMLYSRCEQNKGVCMCVSSGGRFTSSEQTVSLRFIRILVTLLAKIYLKNSIKIISTITMCYYDKKLSVWLK